MGGVLNDKGFQECMKHGVDEDKDCTSARLSLTFRLTARTAKSLETATQNSNELEVRFMDHFTEISWDVIMAEVEPGLEPDITKMYGNTYDNHGRMSAEIMHPRFWKDASNFVYKYGNKKHIGKPMGPVVISLCEVLKKATNQEYDWVHATFYPSGTAKLSAHADDEPEISQKSTIACLTFMEDPLSFRSVFIKGNDSAKKRKIK
jgi:hypothetical protein